MEGRSQINLPHYQPGLPLAVEGQASAAVTPSFPSHQAHSSPGSRSGCLAPQGGNLPRPTSASLSLTHLHRPQGHYQTQAYHRPQQPQPIYSLSHIPNDHSPLRGGSPLRTNLGGFHRPAGCLSAYPHTPQPAPVHGLLLPKPALLLPSAGLRPQCGPPPLHPNIKVAPSQPETAGNQRGRLSRRLVRLGQLSSGHHPRPAEYDDLSARARLLNQSRKILPDPITVPPLVGPALGPPARSVESASRKSDTPLLPHQCGSIRSILHSQKMGVGPGTTEFCSPLPRSPPPSSTTSPSPPEDGVFSSPRRAPSNPFHHAAGPASVAIPRCPDIFLQVLSCRSSSVPLDRRIPRRMGRAHSAPAGFRRLGHRSEGRSYKFTRGQGGLFFHPSPRHQGMPPPPLHRQSGGSICHQQGTLPLSVPPCGGPLSPNPSTRKGSHYQGSPNLQPPKLSGRCPQQGPSPSSGNCPPKRHISKDCPVEGPSSDRPDGHSHQHQVATLRQPVSRSRSHSAQCPLPRLEPMVPNLPVPPPVADPAGPGKVRGIQGPRRSSPPMAPIGEVVPPPNETNGEEAPPPPRAAWVRSLRNSNRLQFLEEVLTYKQGPRVASQLLLAFRDSTNRQSQSVWKAFQSWLPPDTTSISSSLVLEFLIFLSESKHLSPRTILNYKGCLAWPLMEAFGLDLNSHDFSLLARSLFLQHPPQRRRVPRWSVDTALTTYQSERFSLHSASQEDLFLKALFLTALASGNRASELAATVRSGVQHDQSSITLPVAPTFLFKNQSLSNPSPPGIVFPSLPSNRNLCPVTFLSHYIHSTETLPHQGFIFIHPKTHAPLKAGRLSYWLARAIQTGDPIGGSGHDLRKVGFSYAFARGLELSEIVKNGSWQSASVFIRNYLICTQPLPCTQFVAGRS